jgi:hypothetical protein
MTAPAVRDLPPPPGGGGVNPLSILLGLLFGGGGGTASAVGQWSAAVGYEPGQVAVAYLVARSSGGQDAYISVTHDALNANPVFYASMINPPDRPMVTTTQAGDDWIMVDVGPDGTPWGSFYSDCLKDQAGNYTDPYCAQTQGVEVIGQAVGPSHATTVGRLVWQ